MREGSVRVLARPGPGSLTHHPLHCSEQSHYAAHVAVGERGSEWRSERQGGRERGKEGGREGGREGGGRQGGREGGRKAGREGGTHQNEDDKAQQEAHEYHRVNDRQPMDLQREVM